MKLYFAFSNSILFNQTNLQANLESEKGDVLVWSTPPIDWNLVHIVEKSGIFEHVWYLERPKIIEGKRLKKFASKRLIQEFYNQYLDRILSGQKYDEFVVAGFWNDVLYIVNYLLRKYPQIKISICEEGLLNYYCGDEFQNLYYMVQNNRKQNLKAWLMGGTTFRHVQKKINAVYLLAPDFLKSDVQSPIYTLPSLSNTKEEFKTFVKDVFDATSIDIYQQYAERNFYYIASSWNRNYDPVDIGPSLLECIQNIVPPNKLVIKTHTNATIHRKNFAKKCDREIFVDRNVYLFEILCNYLDLTDKIFILRNSSIALNLIQFFEKQPIFIFTHRLYSRYHYGMDNCGDVYVEDLKKHVKNPERIFVPNSMSDFETMLFNLSYQYCGGIKTQKMLENDVDFESDTILSDLKKWLEENITTKN